MQPSMPTGTLLPDGAGARTGLCAGHAGPSVMSGFEPRDRGTCFSASLTGGPAGTRGIAPASPASLKIGRKRRDAERHRPDGTQPCSNDRPRGRLHSPESALRNRRNIDDRALKATNLVHLRDSADTGTVTPTGQNRPLCTATAGSAASIPRFSMRAACQVTAIFLPSAAREAPSAVLTPEGMRWI